MCFECSGGTFSEAGSSECTKCDGGTWSNTSAAACTDCDAGTYSGSGAEACTDCDAGKYSDDGAASCYTLTVAKKWSPAVGLLARLGHHAAGGRRRSSASRAHMGTGARLGSDGSQISRTGRNAGTPRWRADRCA